ncbi:hypothetical protein HK100_001615 [Physocladia obscura]|uniref:fumarate reductase (NADH) n=1 Tax=Physocladia obscura TaxID=109957 RepID=A0AAD5XEE0_9FUNG|nr:hypothetical protein HK100_001615 [Physocladia obscura]
MSQVIVIGGGLAGLSACHTVLERGGNVLLLDKNNFLGGNSTKATSGINGAGTTAQQRLGIPDTSAIFYEDSAKSARAEIQPALTKVLTYQSGAAVEWISDAFKVDLSLVSRLGGHSQPRTHRGKEMFPGMTITYALMEKYEDTVKSNPDRAKLIKKARVTKLIKNEAGTVIGVEYEVEGAVHKAFGPVIIATGGYAADFTETSLLKKYRPEIYDLPTTNGDHCTGDGIKFSLDAGANTIHMDKVQVHPTGLVDLKDPNAKVKFLAAEALRGVGGLLLDATGNRFCDELGHRDYVTGQMWKGKGPFRLVLNSKAGKEIEWHCKHYVGRGLMRHFKNGAELAKDIGIPVSTLEETFKKYNQIAASKNCPFGKKFFHNAPFDINDNFWVSIVCPVLHFTMGGVQIDDQSRLLGGSNAQPIPGAFACGEVAGGVHGANRLGGSSLLGCVVYGRVAGASAATYLLENLTKGAATRVAGIAGHISPISISFNGLKVTVESGDASIASSSQQAIAPTPAPAAAAKPTEKKVLREITAAEVAKHNKENDCWVIVNGQVLDATPFLKDHPGGKKAILIYAGKDATEEFNMMHKRDVVDKYAPEIIIGTFLLVSLTIAMLVLSYPYALEWRLYSLHPLGMAMFAWASGTAAIVLSISGNTTATIKAGNTNRVSRHALLGFVALASISVGIAAIYANKIRQNKLHFQSYHAISGLGAGFHYFPVVMFGSLLRSKRYLFLKRYAGYATLLLSLYTFGLGLIMHSTEERLSPATRLLIFSAVVATVLSSMWNFLIVGKQAAVRLSPQSPQQAAYAMVSVIVDVE